MIAKTSPRILLVTAHCPHGPTYGAQLRTLHIARALKLCGDLGIAIFPFGPLSDEAVRRTREEFNVKGIFHLNEPTCRSVAARLKREFDPYSADTEGKRLGSGDAERMEELCQNYDLIWFQGIALPNCLGKRDWPRSVLDIDDVPSQCYTGKAREAPDAWSRMKATRKAIQWKRRESVLLDRFTMVTVCSEKDRRYFGESDRVQVIRNGFEAMPEIPKNSPAEKRIGFIGTLKYAPNIQGLKWFVEEVWPLVRAKDPSARLRVVGASADMAIGDAVANIDELGFVEDTAEEISTWSLMVVPILVGGGTRIKIAEAFSRRCPVVTTTQGAYGYTLTDGGECFLADDAKAFAAACSTLIEDESLGRTMAQRARAMFDRELNWGAIEPRIVRTVDVCLQSSFTATA
jgi:polysaccharide biosynthesis protein PslH